MTRLPEILLRERAIIAGPPGAGPRDRLIWAGAGVFDSAGRPDLAAGPMMAGAANLPAARVACPERLEQAAFCGRYRPHFGHLLAEGIGRLWSVDRLGSRLPLVWFGHPDVGSGPYRMLGGLLRLLGISNPVRIVTGALAVERLYLPQSLSDPLAGLPPDPGFQDWFAERLASADPGETTDRAGRLYVSRRRLGDEAGRYLGEAALEAALGAEGYRILHPQSLPLGQQVAAYREARQIVLAEGSPLHLLALLDVPGQEIAVVMRRPRAVAGIAELAKAFRRARLDRLDRISACWSSGPGSNLFRVVSELDFPSLWQDLRAGGFVEAAAMQGLPDAARIRQERLARAPDRPLRLPGRARLHSEGG